MNLINLNLFASFKNAVQVSEESCVWEQSLAEDHFPAPQS